MNWISRNFISLLSYFDISEHQLNISNPKQSFALAIFNDYLKVSAASSLRFRASYNSTNFDVSIFPNRRFFKNGVEIAILHCLLWKILKLRVHANESSTWWVLFAFLLAGFQHRKYIIRRLLRKLNFYKTKGNLWIKANNSGKASLIP